MNKPQQNLNERKVLKLIITSKGAQNIEMPYNDELIVEKHFIHYTLSTVTYTACEFNCSWTYRCHKDEASKIIDASRKYEKPDLDVQMDPPTTIFKYIYEDGNEECLTYETSISDFPELHKQLMKLKRNVRSFSGGMFNIPKRVTIEEMLEKILKENNK